MCTVTSGRGADAVQRQLLELDFAPPFQFGAPVTFEFANKLAEYAPPGLDRIFFTNSGSESVETALKIAYAWQRARGKGTKTRFIARERGYHGVNVGGTGLSRNASAVMRNFLHMRAKFDHNSGNSAITN